MMFPIYEALFQEGLILLLHAGVDIGLPPPVHCTPDRLARVLDRCPGGKIVAAHMGGFRCWEESARLLAGRELYFDTSYSFTELGAVEMAGLARAHGVDRVLFGTDSPWTAQAEELAKIRRLDLLPLDQERILGRNALLLLGAGTS